MIQVGNVKITRIYFHSADNIQVDGSVLGHDFSTSFGNDTVGAEAEIPKTSILEVLRYTFRQFASHPPHGRHAEEYARALRILDGA